MYAGAILKYLILFRRREVFVVVLPVCAMLFLVRQSKSWDTVELVRFNILWVRRTLVAGLYSTYLRACMYDT